MGSEMCIRDRSTFGLPNLQGSAPMHPGQGPGLSQRVLGEMSGTETVTLLQSEIPQHSHALNAQNAPGDTSSPAGMAYARVIGATPYRAPGGGQVLMAPEAVALVGGGQPHNNMQPYLTLNFCIALQGIFPPRG